ncbi:hypothetical protein ABZ135_01395 [Streptomyces sp. NPDC006339]|uniref:hypothetical protein n=1 Tax=Streptomyces sp. NPDC006339 TaxID=3156755 RepID=UPI00339EC3BD
MHSFVITTVDGLAYRQGEPAERMSALVDLGAHGETLDSFEYDMDCVVLRFGDYTLTIPDARIAHIAERDSARAVHAANEAIAAAEARVVRAGGDPDTDVQVAALVRARDALVRTLEG